MCDSLSSKRYKMHVNMRLICTKSDYAAHVLYNNLFEQPWILLIKIAAKTYQLVNSQLIPHAISESAQWRHALLPKSKQNQVSVSKSPSEHPRFALRQSKTTVSKT